MANQILRSLTGALLFTVTINGTSPGTAPMFDNAFWKVWSDGQAELAGYDLTIPRYTKPRRGVAVTIFVTETFTGSLRVKSDAGKHPPSDEYPVMKLNLVKDYQTGIYDYNEMTSSWVALQPERGRSSGSPVKVSFSRQEWCGNTYHQLLFDPASVRAVRHSYFDGDADSQLEMLYPPEGVSEDTLLLWARGMAAPRLTPGQSKTAPVLPSVAFARGLQKDPWQQAVFSRSPQSQSLTVPAGTFEIEVWTVRIGSQDTRSFYVEKAFPHRILKWESSSGEHAEMIRCSRMKYWELNQPGGETALQQLGLKPRPARTN